MRTMLLLVFSFVLANAYCQSSQRLTSNVSTLSSGSNPLHKPSFASDVQVQSEVGFENNAVTDYKINFLAPPLIDENTSDVSNVCVLQAGSSIFTGVLENVKPLETDSAKLQQYTCNFSKDFYNIVKLRKVTLIKIFTTNKTGTATIDKAMQLEIINQAKSLLQSVKDNRN